jgi:hypothetical protein
MCKIALVRSPFDILSERAEELRELLRVFLLEKSSLREVKAAPASMTPVTRLYTWEPLDVGGRQLQARLRSHHANFVDQVVAMLEPP